MIEEIVQLIKDVRSDEIKSMEKLIDIQYALPETRNKARSNQRVLKAFKELHTTILRERNYHNLNK